MAESTAVSPGGDGQPPLPAPDVLLVGVPWRLVGLVVALCALPALVLGSRIDSWAAAALGSTASAVGAAALIVGLLAFDVALPVPSSLVATVAGQRLGFAGATVAIAAGLCLGNTLGYMVGRMAASPVPEGRAGPRQPARARARLGARPGVISLVATRPVPILSEAAVVLAGVARAPVLPTAAACGLANVGVAAVYAGLGSAARGPLALPLAPLGAVGMPALALAAAALLRPASASGREPGGPRDEVVAT